MSTDAAKICLVSIPGGWPDDFSPRSAVFDVVPEGVCGATYESLYSIFRRISTAHLLRPFTLAVRAVSPLFGRSGRTARYLGEEEHLLAMNGSGELAERWSASLSRLTLRGDLHVRTLLPLRRLVPYKGLLCRRERFCAECFRDDERKQRPKYHRLLWAITCVEACPIHGTLLQEEADSEREVGAKAFRPRPYWLPGASRVTGRSLAELPSALARPDKVGVASLVANLLNEVHHNPQIFSESACATSSFLRYATDFLFDGVPAYFANHLGVTKGTLHGWMSGKIHPSLPKLTLIAHCCGCTLTDILLANKVPLRKTEPFERTLNKPRRQRESVSDEEIIAALANALKYEPDACAYEIARRLGVGFKRARRVEPEMWAALVQRRVELRCRRRDERKEYRFSIFYRSFKHFHDRGRYPSRQLVSQDVFERTGMVLSFSDKFVQRAHALWGTQPRSRGGKFRSTQQVRKE